MGNELGWSNIDLSVTNVSFSTSGTVSGIITAKNTTSSNTVGVSGFEIYKGNKIVWRKSSESIPAKKSAQVSFSFVDTSVAQGEYVTYSAYLKATGAWAAKMSFGIKRPAAPVISGSDAALGTFGQMSPGDYSYTVTDADGDGVTVTEKIDGTVLRTYQPVLGETNVLSLSTDQWLTVLNGTHTLTITADDGKGGTAVRTLTLTKSVTELSFYLWPPLESTDMASRAIESIVAQIPDGAESKIEVCNNAYDAEPAWQDVTQIVARGDNIVLKNTTKTADKWGYSVRVRVQRNGASGDCYVSGGSGFFD